VQQEFEANMSLVNIQSLVTSLSPPFDSALTLQLVDEFVSAERRFIQRDWEPAELDGGQFSEIAGRILYHLDSGTLNANKDLDECLKFIENETNKHNLPRRDSLHLSRVLRTVYKFRSQRGAVHISPTYQANHMDAKFVVESLRWVMNELLRLFWNQDREQVAKAIRELLQFDVPAVGVFEDRILIQRTDLSTEEEILVLLHYAGEQGFSRKEIGKHVSKAPPSITKALQKLVSAACREVIQLTSGQFRLTDLGSRKIRVELSEKLLVS
jgi:hypothetical protein